MDFRSIPPLAINPNIPEGLGGELRRVILQKEESDVRRWKGSMNGEFSGKATYLHLHGKIFGNYFDVDFQEIWRINVPSKINIFIWRVFRNRMPTADNLRKINLLTSEMDGKCPFCKEDDESLSHGLFTYRMVSAVWNHCYGWLNITTALPTTLPIMHFWQHHVISYNKGVNQRNGDTYGFFSH